MAAHQAPPSLGFSRQEHWSGLPFPSPMHESEKWKWSCSVVSDSANPWTAAYQAPPSMGFSRQRVLEWVRYTFTYISYISDLGISFLLKENDHFILKYKCEYLIRTWKEITTTMNSEKLTNVTNIPKSKTTAILFYYLPDNILLLRTHFLSYPFTRLFQMTIAWERFCNLG